MMDWILVAVATAESSGMTQPAWLQLLLAGASGGLAVKLFDVAYQEIRRRGEKKVTVEDFVQSRLDPILKSADELVGKIYSLAQEDFVTVPSSLVRNDRKSMNNVELTNILYLFAQFWAAIEILRRESVYVRLAESPSGKSITRFFNCLESRRVRVLVRAGQRAIGESLILADRDRLRAMGYSEFMTSLSTDDALLDWLDPLIDAIVRTKHGSRRQQKTERQGILQYGVILHSLITT